MFKTFGNERVTKVGPPAVNPIVTGFDSASEVPGRV
jgi:hypothetical protein